MFEQVSPFPVPGYFILTLLLNFPSNTPSVHFCMVVQFRASVMTAKLQHVCLIATLIEDLWASTISYASELWVIFIILG